MKAFLWLGMAGIAVIWGVVSWIKAHSFMDFFSLVFILASLSVLYYVTVQVVKGGTHG